MHLFINLKKFILILLSHSLVFEDHSVILFLSSFYKCPHFFSNSTLTFASITSLLPKVDVKGTAKGEGRNGGMTKLVGYKQIHLSVQWQKLNSHLLRQERWCIRLHNQTVMVRNMPTSARQRGDSNTDRILSPFHVPTMFGSTSCFQTNFTLLKPGSWLASRL